MNMTLYEKIRYLYPKLTTGDFLEPLGTILLVNHLDDRGDHIVKWEHPTLSKPTQEQLDSIE